MGAQTTQSLAKARESLSGHSATSELAASLFAAALGLSGSKARNALSPPADASQLRVEIPPLPNSMLAIETDELSCWPPYIR